MGIVCHRPGGHRQVRSEIEERLGDLGQGRIALMNESGVDVQVLSVTTPALHNLEPEESVILARSTNDLATATNWRDALRPDARQKPGSPRLPTGVRNRGKARGCSVCAS